MKPYIHTVQYYETDRMGITHHSNYIRWMEEARVDMLVQLGWPLERLEALGITVPVVSLDCQYKQTTTFADRVSITVTLTQWTGVRAVLAYEMRKEDGTLAAQGRSEHCFLDQDGRIVRMPREQPAFSADFAALLEQP